MKLPLSLDYGPEGHRLLDAAGVPQDAEVFDEVVAHFNACALRRWTLERPTWPGVYWYADDCGDATVVEVDGECAWVIGGELARSVPRMRGEWCPLPPAPPRERLVPVPCSVCGGETTGSASPELLPHVRMKCPPCRVAAGE